MRTKTQKILMYSMAVLATFFAVIGLLDINILPHILATAGGGVAIAMAAIPGGTVTEQSYHDNDDNLLERDVDELVVLFKPDRFPLTTMMQNMGNSKPASARKYEWIAVGYHSRSTTVGSGGSSAGTGGNPVDIPVNDVRMWGAQDLVYTSDLTIGSSPKKDFRGYVVSTDDSGGTIKVLAINGDNVPATSGGETVVRLSRAASASDAQTEPHGEQGVEMWNYVQTFIGQFEIEKILQAISTYTDDQQIQSDLEMFDFRNSMENSRLFGTRQKVWDPAESKYVYTMAGVESYAGRASTFTSGGITENDWIDINKDIFKGNAGSEQRLVIGGSDFLADVLKVPSVQKQQDPDNVDLVLGVNVSRVQTNFGELLLKWHKGFDEAGRSHDAFALDMNYIRDRVLEPMETTDLNLDESGQRRVDATRLLQSATLEVQYPDCHTILTPA